jgi:uncharacterized protein
MMKNDAEAHLRRAREFLEDANVLLAKARYPRCASCAYYAMFHAAHAMLVSEGLELQTHDAVKTKFGELFVKNQKVVTPEFGRMLAKAQDFRLDADYAIDARGEIEPGVAKQQLENAGRFVAMVEAHLRGEA